MRSVLEIVRRDTGWQPAEPHSPGQLTRVAPLPVPLPGLPPWGGGYPVRVSVRQLSPEGRDPEEQQPGGGRIGPTLRTADGVDLATRCWKPEGSPIAKVVICHGLTGNKDDPKVVALARTLCDQGYQVVTYDARGHGHSGGISTLGKLEVRDVATIIRWVGASGGRLVLVGASMGALGALAYAADDPSVTGVVTISSPGDWILPLRFRSLLTAGMARTRAGRRWAKRKMNVRIGPWVAPESAKSLLAGVACPVVVVHGSADPIIPRRFSLADGLQEGSLRELVVVPGMGHAFDPVGLAPVCDAIGRLVGGGSRPAEVEAGAGSARSAPNPHLAHSEATAAHPGAASVPACSTTRTIGRAPSASRGCSRRQARHSLD